MQRRNYRGRDLHHEPSNDRVSDGDFVDIAPFQFSEEVLRVHAARLDEALVTEALYLDTRDLKSACNVQNNQCRCSPYPCYPATLKHCSKVSGKAIPGFRA